MSNPAAGEGAGGQCFGLDGEIPAERPPQTAPELPRALTPWKCRFCPFADAKEVGVY